MGDLQQQGMMQQPLQPGMQQPEMMQQSIMQPGMDTGMPSAPPVTAPGMQAMSASGPPGAPPGGRMIHEKYMGSISWVSAGVVCFFTCCGCLVFACPCDERDVYVAPNGQKYTSTGALIRE